VASAINFIDGSALEVLTQLVERLRQMGVGFALAEVKGPVMDRLKMAGFVEKVGAERFFLSTHQAMQARQIPGDLYAGSRFRMSTIGVCSAALPAGFLRRACSTSSRSTPGAGRQDVDLPRSLASTMATS
jgi:hypothetical protein